jgi:1-acyl-sn-glycerol-3-phosphate acyltransferase
MHILRSAVFLVLMMALTLPYGVFSPLLLMFPRQLRHSLIRTWARMVTPLARVVLGIRYRVEGLENLPDTPVVFLSKHQSAWETIAFQVCLPPIVFVLKRELLRIPFFGWGLKAYSPIAIDRGAGREALKQLVEQGQARLNDGFSVVVFPEGTRIAPGHKGTYQIGGAWLACKAGAKIVPIAHNAGECWGKRALIKHAGVVTVKIGPAIDTAGRKPAEVNAAVEAWIEGQMAVLPKAR